ncbi:MAG: prepilin-type N-terminal cleavage/methylation domain-containing protein [Verrucomicrobiota bacterium]|nr:MAG: prepilin-type N-terminal cleavage/methylation domain-containing protein [Verrucomicrobiota bacterium]
MTKRGFSLLEVVLAIGLLGSVLVVLLGYMVDSAKNTRNTAEKILLQNAQRNFENYFLVARKPLMSEGETLYYGRRGDCWQLNAQSVNFDGEVFLLKHMKTEQSKNIAFITYGLLPWSAGNRKTVNSHPTEIVQAVAVSDLEN